ncbi:MAG: bifunctional 4-hydroxy-2-oxoglutarate aldolase/2-dehydro-3-deoxy-phosphogluconate aldolase [Deltaproteobacteria bacterium]|nr:bifunctional 4-hydroxy-2-oxoglutarate aldolase/2-dehydro-3-deoxy-phosphogluconate aldolase [Deltaproteobacteria bacterium]
MAWSREKALGCIREVGLIPIIRAAAAAEAARAAEAIVSAGVGIVEITVNTPGAITVIEQLARRHGDALLLGAGTVLDAGVCQAAITAGAEFIVSPTIELPVIDAARRAGKVCIPGALTPNEVLAAWRAGADLVKVFPCGPAGGAKYVKALKGPLPHIELVVTGDLAADTIPDLIRAGVTAIGLGSELFDWQALREGRLEEVSARAGALVEMIRAARQPRV